MRFIPEYPAGATPLDPDEIAGLIPSFISTQGELNAAEQANIASAQRWVSSQKHKDILTDDFIREIHRRMFSDVWKWAGKYRNSESNIGVAPHQIAVSVRNLCDDTGAWISHKDGWDELGACFHHRLVSIHPFPNGNGRHARLMTNVLLTANGVDPFTWGSKASDEIGKTGTVRDRYTAALKKADKHQLDDLIRFARS
jgi:Fic-DOC domain mobile mystery protein B